MAKHRPKPVSGEQVPIVVPERQVSFEKNGFDQLVRSQGVTLCHHKALPSPIGATDRDDIRHPNHSDNESVSQFIYRKAGSVTVFFQSNAGKNTPVDMGELKLGSAMITVPRYYDGTTEPALLTISDRLYFQDVEMVVENWQRMECHATGVDRLTYPATCVEFLVDSHGVDYLQGQDFTLDGEGRVVWKAGGRRHATDPATGRGGIYSVRYKYIPHWYVSDLLHEVRVAQITDPATGERRVERQPYLAKIQREYVWHAQQNREPGEPGGDEDKGNKNSPPRSGGLLGPR